MLEGKNIVCFGSSWYIDPTSKHQVMKLLAEKNRVLWVNYHASRRPSLKWSDFKTILGKLREAGGGGRGGGDTVTANLEVITPLLVPLPGSRAAEAINASILRRKIRKALAKFGDRPTQVWTFSPDISYLAGAFDEELLVYYCVDEFSEFEGYDKELVQRKERDLLARAGLVVTTAQSLQDSKSPHNENTHLVQHGVDHAHFARTLDDDVSVHPDVADLEGPVLGFFGLLQDWVDVELMADLARARPQWQLVVIGHALTDVSALEALPNVRLLGRRPYAELPSFARKFDLGLIPFRINELTRNVNPIKLREYLSAGMPVVSTPLPEVGNYAHQVEIADRDHFLAACERALASDSPAARRERSASMASEAWRAKVEHLSDLAEAAAGRAVATA